MRRSLPTLPSANGGGGIAALGTAQVLSAMSCRDLRGTREHIGVLRAPVKDPGVVLCS